MQKRMHDGMNPYPVSMAPASPMHPKKNVEIWIAFITPFDFICLFNLPSLRFRNQLNSKFVLNLQELPDIRF